MPSGSARRVLGRGLADLIPVGGGDAGDSRSGGPGNASEPAHELPIASIHANPGQPRTRFDEAALAELAESIRANGVLQPILVRPRPTGGYEIVAGERRYRAALRVGIAAVPVVIRELSDEDALALALIENLIREDIGPLETARAFHRLMADYGWTQEEMGRRVGKSRSAVANALRLLSLPATIQDSLERGELTEGHARTLIGDEKQRAEPGFGARQHAIWREITTKGLSVRDTERRMRGDTAPSRPSASSGREQARAAVAEQADFRAIEDRLRAALGTQIRLIGTADRGRLEIEYFSPGELDGLIERMER